MGKREGGGGDCVVSIQGSHVVMPLEYVSESVFTSRVVSRNQMLYC